MLVFFSEDPLVQIVIMSISAAFMFGYILIIRPQHQKIMLFLNALAEFLLLFLHLFSLAFLDPDLTVEKADELGLVVNITVAGYILLNWVLVLGILFIEMFGKFKRWRANRKVKKTSVDTHKEERK